MKLRRGQHSVRTDAHKDLGVEPDPVDMHGEVDDAVDVERPLGRLVEYEQVAARPADQSVQAETTDQDVVSPATGQAIVAGIADE